MKKFLMQQQIGKLQFSADFKEFYPCYIQLVLLKVKVVSASPDAVVKFDALAHSNLETLQSIYNNMNFCIASYYQKDTINRSTPCSQGFAGKATSTGCENHFILTHTSSECS